MMTKKKITLKDWADDDKPREKLLNKGISTLSDAELIAILIGSGNREKTAVELSREILQDQNSNLNLFGKLSINDLTKYKGIGDAKAVSIVAALELGKRRNFSELIKKTIITESKDIFDYISPILCDIDHEEFWVVLLNNSNKIIKKIKIGQGGITKTSVDIRLIMKSAIENFATAIILCHNHPSGVLIPSKADISITKTIRNAGEILNIKLIDHIILGDISYYSFADNSLI